MGVYRLSGSCAIGFETRSTVCNVFTIKDVINSDSVVKLEDFVINNDMYSCWNEKEILLC